MDAPAVHDVPLLSRYSIVDLDEHPELVIPNCLDGAFGIATAGEARVALGVYEPSQPDELRRHPSVRARRYLFWNILGSPETLKPLSLVELVELAGRSSPWLADVLHRSQPGSPGRLRLQTSRSAATRAAFDGLVLIGDAAHPMLPAALSAAVAVEDARCLGAALADSRRGATLRERAADVRKELGKAAFAKVREAERIAGPAFGLAEVGI